MLFFQRAKLSNLQNLQPLPTHTHVRVHIICAGENEASNNFNFTEYIRKETYFTHSDEQSPESLVYINNI